MTNPSYSLCFFTFNSIASNFRAVKDYPHNYSEDGDIMVKVDI